MNTPQPTVPILDGLTPPKNPEIKKEWFERTSGIARDGILKFFHAFITRIALIYVLIFLGIISMLFMIIGIMAYIANQIW
jgi:hypothetical protein